MNQDEGDPGIILREAEIHLEAQNPGFGVTEVEGQLTQLQLLIESGAFDAAFHRLHTHPHEILPVELVAEYKGRNLTALHIACELGDCPFDLIQYMIAIEPMVVSMRDRDGNTALHMACACEHAYNSKLIATLVAAFPQAVLMQDKVEKSTPLHMLLLMGGDVNMTSLSIILDVAYSRMAGLPDRWVPVVDFIMTSLDTTVQIAAQYPPIVTQVIREMAIDDPFTFPPFLRPFLNLPAPETTEGRLQMFDNQKRLLAMVDNQNKTPLHILTTRGMPLSVVKKLLNEARYQGAHEAARVMDYKCRCPLHYCGVYGMPLEAIKPIFDLYQDPLYMYESYCLIPVQMTYLGLVNSFEDRKLEITATREDPNMPIDDFFKFETACDLYKKVEFVLRLTYTNTYEDIPGKPWRVVHAAAASRVPPLFTRAAFSLHPWQSRERDENHDLPLHLAAKISYQPEGSDPDHIWAHKGIDKKFIQFRVVHEDKERDVPIAICLQFFRDGARYLDAQGCLPLHCAVRTGKGWTEGVKQLMLAEPMALQSRDGVHRSFPVMLAAMEDNNTLDTVFRLLRANPTVIMNGNPVGSSIPIKPFLLEEEDDKRTPSIPSDDEEDRKPAAVPRPVNKEKM